jgi:hypothetical protein
MKKLQEISRRNLSVFIAMVLFITLIPTATLWVHATGTEIDLGAVLGVNADAGGTGWTYTVSNRIFEITGDVTIVGSRTFPPVGGGGNVRFNVSPGAIATSTATITNANGLANGVVITGGGTFNMTGGEISGQPAIVNRLLHRKHIFPTTQKPPTVQTRINVLSVTIK